MENTQGQELTHGHSGEDEQEHVGGHSENQVAQGAAQDAHQQGQPPPSHIAPAALGGKHSMPVTDVHQHLGNAPNATQQKTTGTLG